MGLALARAERERRATARRERRARRASLYPGEPPAAGTQRVILEQLDLAVELLEGEPGEVSEQTVHEIRKALKRLRALMRLLRGELGAKRYKRENAALRDCGQRLAGARDAAVMVATLDALLKRHPKALADSRGVRALRAELIAELIAERERTPAQHDADQTELGQHGTVISDLLAIRARVLAWKLHERRGAAKLLGPGLDRVYRQGQRRLRRARRSKDPEAMHAWRKSVKDLRYVAETLNRGTGEIDDEHGTGHRPARPSARKRMRRRREATKRLRRLARRANRVGEMLGEEHDLMLLARTARQRRAHFAGEARTRKLLLALIARRRKRLRRRALQEGERLYRRKPKRLQRRLRDAL